MFMLPQLGTWSTRADGTPIFLANLLLLQSWVPNNAYTLSFNAVSWSISTEMFFYAVFPFALLVKRHWLAVGICLMLTLAVVGYAELSNEPVSGSPWHYTWKHLILHFPPMRLVEFMTGMATARLFLERGSIAKDTTALECVAVALVFGSVAFASSFSPAGAAGVWLSQCGSFLAFAVLIYVLAAGRGLIVRAMSNPILVRLGEISFATYMIHQIVLRHAVQSKLTALWTTPAAAAIVIVVSYAASYALWRLVEGPARRAILSLAPSRRAAPAE